MDNTIKTVIGELEDMFEAFNQRYYWSILTRPVITVTPDPKRSILGWTTNSEVWKSKDGGASHREINICAEHLARDAEFVAGIMLHEMAHLYNLENGIKDTSRAGTYHNAKFKATAEEHGLICESDPKYGFSITRISPDAMIETSQFMEFIGKKSFQMYRVADEVAADDEGEGEGEGEPEPRKKSTSIKYFCPVCKATCRATKVINLMCGDCMVTMEH